MTSKKRDSTRESRVCKEVCKSCATLVEGQPEERTLVWLDHDARAIDAKTSVRTVCYLLMQPGNQLAAGRRAEIDIKTGSSMGHWAESRFEVGRPANPGFAGLLLIDLPTPGFVRHDL